MQWDILIFLAYYIQQIMYWNIKIFFWHTKYYGYWNAAHISVHDFMYLYSLCRPPNSLPGRLESIMKMLLLVQQQVTATLSLYLIMC